MCVFALLMWTSVVYNNFTSVGRSQEVMGNVIDHFIYEPPTNDLKNARTSSMRIVQNEESGMRVPFMCFSKPEYKTTIVYFHGNAESIADVVKWLSRIHRETKCNVVCMEYIGYSLYDLVNDGKHDYPHHDGIISDSKKLYKYVKEHLKSDSVVSWGRSLGCVFAIRLAACCTMCCLVIESGFLSPTKIYTPFSFGITAYNNERYILNTKCKTLVVHGKTDKVIPWSHSATIAHMLETDGRLFEYVLFDGLGHNSIDYGDSARKLIRKVHKLITANTRTTI